MQDVKIIDIDNVQWNIKDEQARNKITTLENNGTFTSNNMVFNCNIANQYNYGEYVTIPKGIWLAIFHFDFNNATSLKHLLGIDPESELIPSRSYIQIDGANGGFGQVNCIIQSDGTKRVRPCVFNYGVASSNLKVKCAYSIVKLHD